jgi:uncharacterized membrane protein YphA (DoxX/SURF4 family)
MAVDQAGVLGPRSLRYWRGFDQTVPGGWVALVLRLGLATVWLVSGLHTITDLAQARAAVGAYKLFPYEVNVVIGSAQPILETLLGLALLVGVAVRVAAVASVVLFAVFIAGIISVWARGMRIDCGCFSSGGQLAADQGTTYGWDILRDVGFIVLALLVFVWSRSRFSVDSLLFPAVPLGDDGDE